MKKNNCIMQYCVVIILKIEKKHTIDFLCVNVKFQTFCFLCWRESIVEEKEMKG